MSSGNPYQAVAGPALDALIHSRIMGGTGRAPAYSSDENAAELVLAKLRESVGVAVVVGRTRLRRQGWFARYESDPSDGTETLGDTKPLAICRLALVNAAKSGNWETD
jgi:hypothetical protein